MVLAILVLGDNEPSALRDEVRFGIDQRFRSGCRVVFRAGNHDVRQRQIVVECMACHGIDFSDLGFDMVFEFGQPPVGYGEGVMVPWSSTSACASASHLALAAVMT